MKLIEQQPLECTEPIAMRLQHGLSPQSALLDARAARRARRWERVSVVACVVSPVLIIVLILTQGSNQQFAMDFHNQYWPVGNRVLSGLSPYDLSWQDIDNHIGFPYGAVAALLFVPFALLPVGAADWVYTAVLLASLPLTLRLLNVRDWRVYGIVFLWVPVTAAIEFANVSLLLGCLMALMWRYRDRALVLGLLFALLLCIKQFVWPLAIWMLGTRRYKALAFTFVAGVALNLAAWTVIGFGEIDAYLNVLRLVAEHAEQHTFTLQAAAAGLGLEESAAYGLMFLVAIALAAYGLVLARRGESERALLLCVAVGFLATPVTWPHYWAVLIVPLALLRPSFGLLWTIPVVMAPVALATAYAFGSTAMILAENAMIAALVFGAALRNPSADRPLIAAFSRA